MHASNIITKDVKNLQVISIFHFVAQNAREKKETTKTAHLCHYRTEQRKMMGKKVKIEMKRHTVTNIKVRIISIETDCEFMIFKWNFPHDDMNAHEWHQKCYILQWMIEKRSKCSATSVNPSSLQMSLMQRQPTNITMEIFKDMSIYRSPNIVNDGKVFQKSRILSSNETLNALKVSVNPETAFQFY